MTSLATEQSFGGWLLAHDYPSNTAAPYLKVGFIASAWCSFTSTCGSATLKLLTNPEFGYSCAWFEGTTPIAVETTAEMLQKVRDFLKPSMVELANVFGVSRQTLYNWTKGEDPRPEHLQKLEDLATAASMLAAAGLAGSRLLSRKIHDGKSILEVSTAGGSATEGALLLIDILEKEAAQRERMANRFSGRKASRATADFDFPAPNDQD